MGKVARQVVEQAGVNVDVLLDKLVRAAGAEFTTFYYYTILRVNAIGFDGEDLAGGVAPDGTVVDLAAGRWLLNPGSVGQPRDGDPRAAYLLLEPGRRAEFHRVDYPIERTQAEMRDRGLPEALVARLTEGL